MCQQQLGELRRLLMPTELKRRVAVKHVSSGLSGGSLRVAGSTWNILVVQRAQFMIFKEHVR